MAMTEKARHDLHTKLEQVLGSNPAETLMGALPPVGWADVATKRDLEALQQATGLRLEGLEARLMAAFRGELNTQTKTMIFALAGILVPFAGVVFAAARLL